MYSLKVDKNLELALTLPTYAEAIYEIVNRNRDEFKKWFPWVEQNLNSDDTKEFLQECLQGLAKGKLLHNTIIYKGKIVGVVDARLKPEHKKGDVGYWLDKEYWGKGIMSKSVKAFINFCFREYNLEKLTIHCDIDNCSSCNVAKRAGMKQEALLRKHFRVNGEQRDFYRYCICKDEIETK